MKICSKSIIIKITEHNISRSQVFFSFWGFNEGIKKMLTDPQGIKNGRACYNKNQLGYANCSWS